MTAKHTFGWLPDLPDARDYIFKTARIVSLPSSVDLRRGCSAIEDQGNLGSCTSQAVVGVLEFLELKDGVTFFDLSRLFVYYNTRVLERTVKYDSGASLRNTVKAVAKQGVCTEVIYPYIEKKYKLKPGPECYTDGLKRRVLEYSRLLTLQDMKVSLAEGFPFVCGISLYESFESEKVAETGIVNMPTRRESIIGGHAIVVCGYDDKTSRFIVRNSWGTDFGMDGYFTIPYKYITTLGDDFWQIKRGSQLPQDKSN